MARSSFLQGAFLASVIIGISIFMLTKQRSSINSTTKSFEKPSSIPLKPKVEDKKEIINLLLNQRHDCTLMYKDETLEGLSEVYKREKEEFLETVKKARGRSGMEGHTGQVIPSQKFYHHLVKDLNATTVCETGFNAGHSAFTYLTANPHTKVYSFDIGSHGYTRKMANYLMKKFPDRLTVTYGNSLHTVPEAAERLHEQCDILIVDGGHRYDVASGDLRNMKRIANPAGHVVVMDDYPPPKGNGMGTGKAWREACDKGNVQEGFICIYPAKVWRWGGLAVGYYKNTPWQV